MLRAGANNFQLLARRLRLFAFEVFFLGTAIVERSLFRETRGRRDAANRTPSV
jgi:hypothetical protein